MRFRLVAALSALALNACASTPNPQSVERDCFRTLDVRSYGVVDDHRVRVHISPQREYILTISQNVQNLDWNHAVSIRSMTSFICVGNGLGVQVMGGDPPFPYSVVNIERAPQESAAAS